MIELKSANDRDRMRAAGRVVAEVLEVLRGSIDEGMQTLDLDVIAEREIRARGATPVFLGYHGYPASVCVSVNNEVVHGIPGGRRLKRHDLVSLDLGALLEGFVGDSAISLFLGEPPNPKALELLNATEQAMWAGIRAAHVGGRIGDISEAVQTTVESQGFSVVRDFVGHGIGRAMHEDPQVPNYGQRGRGVLLRPGLAIAIEPMVNIGAFEVDVLDDDWTVVTRDGSLSCHFEHTIFLSEDGPEVLTQIGESVV